MSDNRGRITTATAREMAARSHEARRVQAELAAATPPDIPQAADDYVRVQLVRVRALLDDVDEQLKRTRDAQDRERLARCSNLLAERWRVLSGIPLPGSRRPGKERAPDRPEIAPLGAAMP